MSKYPYEGTSNQYLSRLATTLANTDTAQMDTAVQLVADAWHRGSQIITLGNGGSSMTALHFINDWNKSIFMKSGKPFLGRSLVDNMGLVMSYSNDVSFQDVFAEQLRNVLQKDDLVIAISGSGNSENVIRAVDYANSNGGITLGLCGYSGGKLRHRAQHIIWAEVDDMQQVEDIHSIFGHIVMQALCRH